ncbi:uncharacterized protein OCT59_018799 [Rhizophagus irregularis]|uniref:uncharacterized protein n=1 Tax=Rhizophagus irregularis TaxID=588596 RepID=UPI003322669F|nr:hypothetical protein OCT59_018799 [Rhizophagus irregularis]
MATKRGEKRRIDDNERFSKRSTEGSEAEKRVRISDDSVVGLVVCYAALRPPRPRRPRKALHRPIVREILYIRETI